MNHARRYQAVAQTTASKERLMVLLMQKAHTAMGQAAEALATADDAGAKKRADDALQKAMDIVVELLSTLDPNASAAVCDTLSNVYSFVLLRLLQAQRGRNPNDATAAARAFHPIVQAFEEAVAQVSHASR
jgi:flagellar biosynthetic protein FliS